MRNRSSIYSGIVVVALASLCGLAVAYSSWRISVAAIVLGSVVAALAVARKVLSSEPGHSAAPAEIGATQGHDELRVPRLVFYAGAATMGLLTVRPALAFTASDWIFLACFGLTCLALFTSRADRDYLIPALITVGVGLFAVGGFLSSFGAVAPLGSVSIIARLLYLTIVWFWLATVLLETRRHVEVATMAWVGAAALSASGALLQLAYGDVIPGGDSAWGRMTGFTPHYNHLGGLVAIAFVPALMLAIDSPRPRVRLFGTGAIGLLAVGLLMSGSVGGLLATVCAVTFWIAIRGVTQQTALRLATVVVAGLVLVVTTGATGDPIERVERVTSAEEAAAGTGGSLYTRLDGYREAWSRISEQPLIGVGLDEQSSVEVLGPKLVHNMLINQWFTAGILGLIGIVALIAGVVLTGARIVRSSTGELRALSSALLAALVAFVVFGMGEPILFVRYGWFPAALLVALHAQARRAERAVTVDARRHAASASHLSRASRRPGWPAHSWPS
jgi:O-antigen ligase